MQELKYNQVEENLIYEFQIDNNIPEIIDFDAIYNSYPLTKVLVKYYAIEDSIIEIAVQNVNNVTEIYNVYKNKTAYFNLIFPNITYLKIKGKGILKIRAFRI